MPTRIQVTLVTDDGIAENYFVNTFAHSSLIEDSTDQTTIGTSLATFYSAFAGSYLSSVLAQNNHIYKLYDLEAPMPNYPIFEGTFNLSGSPAGTPLPAEVAMCLSFQANRVSGQPQARRRGRIYLGPLSTAANTSGRPAAALLTAMLNAGEALYDTWSGLNSFGNWAVWSPTNATAVEIDELYVDDAFDTQRSRGLARTAVTTRVVS